MKGTLICLFLCFSIAAHSQGGIWTWMKGDSIPNTMGISGLMGVTDTLSYPSGRYQAVQWTDINGNFWIFGGGSNANQFAQNDLWMYQPINNTWTWIGGSLNQLGYGHYGIKGLPSLSNWPSARSWGVVSWTDLSGKLWMHGGDGYDRYHNMGRLDDLWMYDIATNEWTWMAGPDTINGLPIYGLPRIASTSSTPGARDECNTAWVKSDGTLWTFGGHTLTGRSNSIWQFDISTNMWTWMNGADTSGVGNYGILNIEDSINQPPSRNSYSHWQDMDDNFYLWGGCISGYGANDVWRYNTSNNKWTWIGGDSTDYFGGIYTSNCLSGGGAHPTGRWETRTAQTYDCSEMFWTFGGFFPFDTCVNDLWVFNVISKEWTWVSGNNIRNSSGNYGTINVQSLYNIPKARAGSCFWADRNGALWLWGGSRATFPEEYLSDMWKFVPDTSCIHPYLFTRPKSIQLSDTNICIGDSVRLTLIGGFYSSITPSFGSTLIDSNHLVLNPTTTTTYHVVLNDQCGNIDTLSTVLFVRICEGITDLSLSDAISLHPNPASQTCTISIYSSMERFSAQLCDIRGQLVADLGDFGSAGLTFPVSSYAKGIYMLRINSSNGSSAVKKLVVE